MNDYIAHHGVKGQKWGVRKSRAKVSAKSKKVKVDKAISTVSTSTVFKGATTISSGYIAAKSFITMGSTAGAALTSISPAIIAAGASAASAALPVIGAVGVASLATTGAIVGGKKIYNHLENKKVK